MSFKPIQIGELAKRTGLTVRALHHYHQTALLKLSHHKKGEYRLYTTGDIARLQQTMSLRQLGLSLDEIRDCLDYPDVAPLEVVRRHFARMREQIMLQQKLCERLEAIATHFEAAEEVSTSPLTKMPPGAEMAPVKLQDSYLKTAGDAARRRIILAGVRLGRLLKSVGVDHSN